MKNKQNIRIAFGLVIFSLLLAILVGAGMVLVLNKLLPNIDPLNLSLLSMLVSTVIIIFPVLLYLRITRATLRNCLRINGISLMSFFAVILISIGFIVIIDELDRIVYALFGAPEFLQELFEQLKITSVQSGILIILTTAIVAPIVEEILFRGYLQKVLEESWEDITKAILVTSLFFALVHLNPYWVVQIYLLGFVLGYLSWRTNSIIPGIILHGLNNGFAVALNNTEDIFNRYYNWHEHVNPIWVVSAVLVVYLGFKILNKDLENR